MIAWQGCFEEIQCVQEVLNAVVGRFYGMYRNTVFSAMPSDSLVWY
jgi:hypothetical protein